MNNITRSLFCSLILVFFATGVSFGAGFRLPEQGAKAMGMSMAWSAQASDPSAIYYNPAGLTQLSGQQVLFGGTLFILPGSEFNGDVVLTSPLGTTRLPTDESGKDQELFGPYGYYTHQASEKLFLGIGIYGPFGLARTYSPTGNIAFKTQHVKLITINVNPTVAYRINDYISVGVGLDFLRGDAELNQIIPPIPAPIGFPGATFHLNGDGDAWGWNAGVLITPENNIRIGFNYRSGYSLGINGSATSLLGSTGVATQIKLPDVFVAAIAYQTERFTIEFDYDYTHWSDFKTLNISLESDIIGLGQTFLPLRRSWGDVAAYRLGFRYNFTEKCWGSIGVFYDENPIPEDTHSALLPDADRPGFSLGAGYQSGKIGVDVAYMLFNHNDRTISSPPNPDFDGTWKNQGHLFGINVSYAF